MTVEKKFKKKNKKMANTIDYKKEYKDLYIPKEKPAIVDVPMMQFVAVEGQGNPNEKDGEYQKAIEILYSIQYTIKMSKKGNYTPKNYFDYVVPPLEGLWWLAQNITPNQEDFLMQNKSKYCWTSMIRLPEFVDKEVFDWASNEAAKKKNVDTTKAQFITITEGLCVQCLHIGAYDDEPRTLKIMEQFVDENGFEIDLTATRKHHEIYLSDPRKTELAKLKTVLRIPVKKK